MNTLEQTPDPTPERRPSQNRRSTERRTQPPARRVSRSITPEGGTPVADNDPLKFPLRQDELEAMVRSALHEDAAFTDLTTLATVRSGRRTHASVVARSGGTIAGVPFAVCAFRLLDPNVVIRVDADDGARVAPGGTVLHISGDPRKMLSAERVALNFLQHFSGIATLTARYVDAVNGTNASILDTRKTLPGYRVLQKYAVRAGGGQNHRLDLAAMVLIKDNHLSALQGDIAKAVRWARDFAPPGTQVEVECDRKEQVEAALDAGADVVLLDNMVPELMAECVRLARGRALTEASGNVRLETVRAIAESGVDWISVGALTHSAPALDVALDFEEMR